jgi:hypothetical protein
MNKSKGGKKDKREGKGKSGEITPGDEKTGNPVIPASEGAGTERKDESQDGSLVKDSEQVKETPVIRSESVDEGKRITGGLGNNPLDRIDPSGLQGLITGSKTQIKIEQDLLYTKAVKLTHEDLEFIKDMAISVKEEGNISAGIRACIKVARKHVGDKIKELAALRKASEAFEI